VSQRFTPQFVTSCIPLLDQNIQQDTAATVYRMASDVDKLLTCVDKFANWWNDAESIIQSLKIHTVFVDDQRINQLRIRTIRTRWEAFRGEYEAYKRNASDQQLSTA